MPITAGYFALVTDTNNVNTPNGPTELNPWINPANAEGSPDGLYTSGYYFPITDFLCFQNWQGVTIPSSAIITNLFISFYGHCSNPANSSDELHSIQAYLTFPRSQQSFSGNLFSLITDSWTSSIDILSLFGFINPSDINGGGLKFYLWLDHSNPIPFSDTTYIDSARMSVVWSLPEELPCYARKRRRFKNKKGKIISQSRFK